MKCRICNHELSPSVKCCPYCGRVITAAERAMAQNEEAVNDDVTVFEPNTQNVSQSEQDRQDKTIHIPDIFSSDPNTPDFGDEHTYDKATADVINYDRMFMSKGGSAVRSSVFDENYTEPEAYDDNEEYEQEEEYEAGTVIRDKSVAKPRLKINFKPIGIAVCVILTIAVIVGALYSIANKVGFLGGKEPTSFEDDGGETAAKVNEDNTVGVVEEDFKTGNYTVNTQEKSLKVYKSRDLFTTVATIPNKTVIVITEVFGDSGKTEYKGFDGWVDMKSLVYSPNSAPEEETTRSEDSSNNSSAEISAQPGTYVVTVEGDTPLNVRATGSTEGDVIGTLTNGASVEVVEVKSSWGKISYNGTEGWVYMEYLR